jgi:Na+/H+ antiporter NhaD/arsenite permease-like protein
VLPVSLGLAALALLTGWVKPADAPGLLDLRVLELFFVLILAVECARRSALFEFLVAKVLSSVRTERGLGAAAVLTAGGIACCVTNDVALLVVVPFTLAFARADEALDPAPLVVLEIHAANLLGCLTPSGNPQNLFLYLRGGFAPAQFFGAQVPWVLGMTAILLAAVPLFLTNRVLPQAPKRPIPVEPVLATAAVGLLGLQVLAVLGVLPRAVPLAAAVPAIGLLGRHLFKTDFSLVAVFAALFIGIEGLRRSPLFPALDPLRFFGAGQAGFVLSGALLSQVVSNVPAAILLAPDAAARGGGALFVALLYGVNAGGCGTPIASLANLIGAGLYVRERGGAGRFWRLFLPVSAVFLAAATALSLALVALR